MTPERERHNLPARMIHWTMAAGFAFMWACGFTMTTLLAEDSPVEDFMYWLHISVGVTLLWLLAARVAIRLTTKYPPVPVSLTDPERVSAKVVHVLLYLMPLAVVAAGWAETELDGHAVQWFGIGMPPLLPENESAAEVAEEAHKWLAYSMLAVVAVHVAAVAKHRWVDGHDVLHRMI